MITNLALEKINLDNEIQPRARLNLLVVDEYAEAMSEGVVFPPIVVYSDGDDYYLADGYHRYHAARQIGKDSIDADIREGTRRDAILHAVGANTTHGMRRTNEDKRRAVLMLLNDPEWGRRSDREIARQCAVSNRFVSNLRKELSVNDSQMERKAKRKGVTYTIRTKNIGQKLAPSVRAVMRDTALADSPTELAKLSRMNAEKQMELAWIAESYTVKTVQDIQRIERDMYRQNIALKWFEQEFRARAGDEICECYMKAYIERGEEGIFHEMVKDKPALGEYTDAVECGEIELVLGSGSISLKIKTLTKEFTGQDWHWPKYSGVSWLTVTHGWCVDETKNILNLDEWDENVVDIPIFSEQEWEEYCSFVEEDALYDLDLPCGDFFDWEWKAEREPRHCAFMRRTYDQNFGRFIVDDKDRNCKCHCGPPFFVKRGWGKWCIVEFNDGKGDRLRRRLFVHDHIGRTLIKQAMDTVDPYSFSDYNFKQLKIFQVQPIETSWYYVRRKTIPREEMIAALEEDLDRLRNVKQLSDTEFTERVLDWLQEYLPPIPADDYFREGVCTYPRLSDGRVDVELYHESFGST